MNENLPGKTDWETHEYLRDRGHRVAAAQAYRYLARRIETDDSYPLPPGSEAAIALAAETMADVLADPSASTVAYAARRVAAIHAAVAAMQPRSAA